MGFEKDPDASTINDILSGIKKLSFACALFGLGSVVCGAIALGHTHPQWDFPFSTCSGLWAGGCAFAMGIVGLVLVRKYDINNKGACVSLLGAYRGLGTATCITAPQHMGYSIAGVVMCAVRATNQKGEEKCNADNHDALLILNAIGIGLGLLMFLTGISAAMYMYKCQRWQTLTGGKGYGGKCCGGSC